MDVLMVSPELWPIAKVGGLGDAVHALAKTLSRLEHKVTVALPRYPMIDDAGLMLARRLQPLRFEARGRNIEATLFDARLPSGVEVVLIHLPGELEGDSIYGGNEMALARRFGLFCRAVAELVKKREATGTPFDVVHAHDWPAALVPLLLRGRSRTVMTVHHAGHQGRLPIEALEHIGLEPSDELTDRGRLGFLRAGVLAADVVTTVSPTYAEDLKTPAAGAGLEDVFAQRAADLVGILHGIDYAQWSPSTDPHIAARYDAEDVANKGRCKAALLHELDLTLDPDRPLFVSLGPIGEDQGSDLVGRALAGITRTGARVVIAGEGDKELAALIEDAVQSAGDDAAYLGAVTEPMAHRLIAAADAVIVPARFEPCGLTQQWAQRYGAVPVAHPVGGLRDTVVDCDGQLETGTGFLMQQPTPDALVAAVERCVGAMKTPRWGVLRRRVMRLDRSWERPARRYARLYLRPDAKN
jgi:starch synthase